MKRERLCEYRYPYAQLDFSGGPGYGIVNRKIKVRMMAMEEITITAGDITVQAQLNESETARRILDILPVEGTANVWGDEIYFSIPLELPQAPDAREEMAIGELGYWP